MGDTTRQGFGNTGTDVYGSIPDVNTDTIGRGNVRYDELNAVLSITKDSVEDGTNRTTVPTYSGK